MDLDTITALDLIDVANDLTYSASVTDNLIISGDDSISYLIAISMVLESLYGLLFVMSGKIPDIYDISFYVYGDMLFRGFEPFSAWVESGLYSLYEPSDEPFSEGSYYMVPAGTHGFVAGMMVDSETLLTLGAQKLTLTRKQKQLSKRIHPDEVFPVFDLLYETLISQMRSRYDQFEYSNLGLVWGDTFTI